MKVFLDTNVLASALATRGLCAELFEVVLQDHQLLISEPLVEELNRVLTEKLGLTQVIVNAYLSLLHDNAVTVSPTRPYPSLPDSADEPIVASALAGDAAVFVTGDKTLLDLSTVDGLSLLSPREFWERLSTA